MKSWQRLTAALLGAVLALGLGACGSGDKKSGGSPKAAATTKPADAGKTWHSSGGGIDVAVTQRSCGYDIAIKNTHDSPNYWVLKVNGKQQGSVHPLSKKEGTSTQVGNTSVTTLIQVLATDSNGHKKSTAFSDEHKDKHCNQ